MYKTKQSEIETARVRQLSSEHFDFVFKPGEQLVHEELCWNLTRLEPIIINTLLAQVTYNQVQLAIANRSLGKSVSTYLKQ